MLRHLSVTALGYNVLLYGNFTYPCWRKYDIFALIRGHIIIDYYDDF